MCDNSSLSSQCPLPSVYGPTNKSTCEQYEIACKGYNALQMQAQYRAGVSPRDAQQFSGCSQADFCYKQVELYEDMMDEHDQCIDDVISQRKEEVRQDIEMRKVEIEQKIVAHKTVAVAAPKTVPQPKVVTPVTTEVKSEVMVKPIETPKKSFWYRLFHPFRK